MPNLVRISAVATAVCALGLSGCIDTLKNVDEGGGLIDDGFWILSSSSEDLKEVQKSHSKCINKMLADDQTVSAASDAPKNPAPTTGQPTQQKRHTNGYAETTGDLMRSNDDTNDEYDGSINECVDVLFSYVNNKVNIYISSLNRALATGSAASDVTSAGLSAAGALVGGATTKILSAVNGAITTSKIGIQSDIFYKKTIDVVNQQFYKDMASAEDIIINRKNKNDYKNIYEALIDIRAYYNAGTLVHAMDSLQSDVGAQANACKSQRDIDKKAGSSSEKNDEPTKKDKAQNNGTNTASAATVKCQGGYAAPAASDAGSGDAETSYDIHFTPSSAELTSNEKTAVKRAADAFTAGKFTSITVVGKIAASGAEAHNLTLSQDRADAVMKELQSDKITAKITATGTDSTAPVSGDDDANRVAIITFVK